ncbi:TatD family hydrolase [Gottfriedia acidiceleris]|uniref:TatD family hydrolase n=1 Tax=Gottfriedia acidiceleris TaxID=371036 RepID=UPI001F26042D|nr:TatD family hydrolase [Gottfriedia acidiceleris]
MKMIDAHIHLDSYDTSQREEILSKMERDEITAVISVSMDLKSSKKNLELKKQNKSVYPAFGFHPEQQIPSDEEVDKLIEWIKIHQHEMVAIGEVGLPYYKNLEEQIDYVPYTLLLEKFISLAKELNKPIVLHAVYEDAETVCNLLEKYFIKKAHFHWFKGDDYTIKRMIKNEYFISITPDVLYENEIQDLVRKYPLELMMVETDGPWPFEGPFENEWTHPKFMHQSVTKIAELKDIDLSSAYKILYENTKKFYSI